MLVVVVVLVEDSGGTGHQKGIFVLSGDQGESGPTSIILITTESVLRVLCCCFVFSEKKIVNDVATIENKKKQKIQREREEYNGESMLSDAKMLPRVLIKDVMDQQ